MSTLPRPTRKNDVMDKLAYAEEQRNELARALFDSYETDELPKFVSMRAEGVLSNARECFDYLAHDLIVGYLIPQATAKFVERYKQGKEKTYFPFYVDQLTKTQWPWHQFKAVEASVFEHLSGFIDAMDKRLLVGYTLFAARDFRVVQEMVNEKKHSNVVQYHAVADAAVFHKGRAGSVVLDKATAGVAGFEIGPEFRGDNPKSVPEFRFVSNGRDVLKLCLFAVAATRTVMDWWYETHFQPTENRINPDTIMLVNGIPSERPVWTYERVASTQSSSDSLSLAMRVQAR